MSLSTTLPQAVPMREWASAGPCAPSPENRGEAAGVAGEGGGDRVCQGWGRLWRIRRSGSPLV